MEQREAAASAALETEALPRFARIYVCSALDREKLAQRVASEISILPNSVRPPAAGPSRPPMGPFLFVGTLGVYPNEDACRYLRTEIVPRLPDFEFQIVGTGASDRLRRLVSHPAIRIIGEVPDVDPWYHNAAAVVVPIRAGGGTRIKILEAFSFRRPVITTTVGAEGIDARHNESILLADNPEQFAEACRRLRLEPGLGEHLAGNSITPCCSIAATSAEATEERPSPRFLSLQAAENLQQRFGSSLPREFGEDAIPR